MARWLVAGAVVGAMACNGSDDGAATAPDSVAQTELAGVPQPADNPTNQDKIELGRLLFWDPILSGAEDVACASCHDPSFGYSDGRATSVGTGGAAVKRGALTILDAAWNGWTDNSKPDASEAPMFWDNRARSFEAQARGPITGDTEMRGPSFTESAIFPELVHRLEAIPDYQARFAKAFGTADINDTTIVCAIASFERTLVTRPSYERYLAGDTNALSAAAKRGLDTFQRDGCSRCHSGPMLSDFTLHRFTRNGEAIRTPSLRNVTRTAPYMHDGRASTLDAVFDIYRRVDRNADPGFADLRAPQRGDRDEIEAFFGATSDGDYDRSVPDSVPSGLAVGGRRAGARVAATE